MTQATLSPRRSCHRSLHRGLWLFVLLLTGIIPAVRAQTTPQFFFYTPGQTPTSYTQGLTSLAVAANQNFTLSVYYQYQPSTAATFFGVNVFVGYDQTNQSGASATPQRGVLTLPSGLNENTAITNVNPAFIDLPNGLGGGQDPSDQPTPSSALRPYGVDVSLADSTGAGFGATGSQPVRLFDITLHNNNLGSGGSQNVVIYSNDPASNATSYTTFLDNGGDPSTFPRPATSTSVNVFQAAGGALPEPGSLWLVLGGGLTGFAVYRTRRR